jgi:2-polyprenyl-3-methyl-5-hydroxy-6-metoxy-1,4-benzoquinol methylase
MSNTRDTDADWALLAERSPYWAVLSTEEYRGSDLAGENSAKFFASGEQHVENLFATISHHFRDKSFSPKRSLDFGCGVGRLLIPIARRSQEAVGVDIAPRMLELSAQHLSAHGVINTSLVRADDDLSRVVGRFDFVNTLIVLQHIPPERGYRLLRKLIDLLVIGGTASIQLTYAKSRQFFQHEAGGARFYRRDGNTITDLVLDANSAATGHITMFDYDLNYVFAVLSEAAGMPIVVLPSSDGGHLGLNMILRRAR